MNKIKYLRIYTALRVVVRAFMVASLVSATVFAQTLPTADTVMPKHAPYPGGVALVKLGAEHAQPSVVTFNGKRVLTLQRADGWYALVGLALDTKPGKHTLVIKPGEGSSVRAYETAFDVKAKQYPAQHLKVERRYVEPPAAEMERIRREQIVIDRAKLHWSDDAPAQLMLDLPATGRLSSRFGLRRIFNGQPRASHAGLDVAVGTGTEVRAAAAGRVINTGDYFFSGNSVFVDHGRGFITLYIHLSRVDVKEGDAVGRGAPLGLSGATGRVTGPHLHWAVLLNGAYVDPEIFLKPAQ